MHRSRGALADRTSIFPSKAIAREIQLSIAQFLEHL